MVGTLGKAAQPETRFRTALCQGTTSVVPPSRLFSIRRGL
jgi:hypothetical protein